MKRASLLTLTLIGAFSAIQAAWPVDYPLPPTGSRLVGQNQTYTVQEGDKNLQAIARRFDTAAMLILEANNTIAPVPNYLMHRVRGLSLTLQSCAFIIIRREKILCRFIQ